MANDPTAGTDGDETRTRITGAAMRCVLRWGVSKTGLSDIAAEAGCSRQTVYNHFDNAEAVVQAALLESSYDFADRMVARIRAYERPEDRVVEAMMFCLDRLPHEPFLKLVMDPALGKLIGESLFTLETSRVVIDRVAGVCLENAPSLAHKTDELSEVMTRLVLSFLVVRETEPRTGKAMRAFLRRWLLPPLLAPEPPTSRPKRAPAKNARKNPGGRGT